MDVSLARQRQITVRVSGIIHHCCSPCVCDTLSYLKVDTKTVASSDGAHEHNVLVYVDPCKDPSKIPRQAPDVKCSSGKLVDASYSDGGHVIVGMLTPVPSDGAYNKVSSVSEMCADRAEHGYHSGMGMIFIDVAKINPLHTPSSSSAVRPADVHEQLVLSTVRRRPSKAWSAPSEHGVGDDVPPVHASTVQRKDVQARAVRLEGWLDGWLAGSPALIVGLAFLAGVGFYLVRWRNLPAQGRRRASGEDSEVTLAILGPSQTRR